MNVPMIETDRLYLRGWQEQDVLPLSEIVGDFEVARYMFGGRPLDVAATRESYQKRVDGWVHDGFGFWAVELKETGELIGWTGLQRVRREKEVLGEVEVGWMLGRAWWGRGYAPEAARAALRWGFGPMRFERILAFCHPDNWRSERVMQKLSMEPAGVVHDIEDGAEAKLYVMTRERWGAGGPFHETESTHESGGAG